jgi:hypothetical protein
MLRLRTRSQEHLELNVEGQCILRVFYDHGHYHFEAISNLFCS